MENQNKKSIPANESDIEMLKWIYERMNQTESENMDFMIRFKSIINRLESQSKTESNPCERYHREKKYFDGIFKQIHDLNEKYGSKSQQQKYIDEMLERFINEPVTSFDFVTQIVIDAMKSIDNKIKRDIESKTTRSTAGGGNYKPKPLDDQFRDIFNSMTPMADLARALNALKPSNRNVGDYKPNPNFAPGGRIMIINTDEIDDIRTKYGTTIKLNMEIIKKEVDRETDLIFKTFDELVAKLKSDDTISKKIKFVINAGKQIESRMSRKKRLTDQLVEMTTQKMATDTASKIASDVVDNTKSMTDAISAVTEFGEPKQSKTKTDLIDDFKSAIEHWKMFFTNGKSNDKNPDAKQSNDAKINKSETTETPRNNSEQSFIDTLNDKMIENRMERRNIVKKMMSWKLNADCGQTIEMIECQLNEFNELREQYIANANRFKTLEQIKSFNVDQ